VHVLVIVDNTKALPVFFISGLPLAQFIFFFNKIDDSSMYFGLMFCTFWASNGALGVHSRSIPGGCWFTLALEYKKDATPFLLKEA